MWSCVAQWRGIPLVSPRRGSDISCAGRPSWSQPRIWSALHPQGVLRAGQDGAADLRFVGCGHLTDDLRGALLIQVEDARLDPDTQGVGLTLVNVHHDIHDLTPPLLNWRDTEAVCGPSS